MPGQLALALPWALPPHGPHPSAAPLPPTSTPPGAPAPTEMPPEVARSLFRHLAVDTDRLTQQLAQLLAEQPCVTLVAVLARFPPTQGLAEIVAYVALAAQQAGGQHLLNAENPVQVLLDVARIGT